MARERGKEIVNPISHESGAGFGFENNWDPTLICYQGREKYIMHRIYESSFSTTVKHSLG